MSRAAGGGGRGLTGQAELPALGMVQELVQDQKDDENQTVPRPDVAGGTWEAWLQ